MLLLKKHKKQKMSASPSYSGVCVAGANSSKRYRAGGTVTLGLSRTYQPLLTEWPSRQVPVQPLFRLHMDILDQVLKMFLRVRAWTAGRRAGSHAFWESDVTAGPRCA